MQAGRHRVGAGRVAVRTIQHRVPAEPRTSRRSAGPAPARRIDGRVQGADPGASQRMAGGRGGLGGGNGPAVVFHPGRVAHRRHHQQVARAGRGHVGQTDPLLPVPIDLLLLVVQQVEGRPAGEPHGAQTARRVDEAAGGRPAESGGRVAEDHHREFESLGPVHGHDPHAVAALFEDRRLARLTFLRFAAQLLDEPAERQAAAGFPGARHLADVQHVGEHLLAGPLHHEGGVRPGRLQQLPDGAGDRHDVAAPVQPGQQLQTVRDGQEPLGTVPLAGRGLRRHAERVQAPETLPPGEQRFVVDGEQRPAERREDGQLVVRPLDGGQRRP